MDYKKRNPNIGFWQHSMIFDHNSSSPFPYDQPSRAGLFEIDAPDLSTQFLGLPFHLNDSEDRFVSYLIEASEDCPIRRKFEFGDITWKEFWHHRRWLIEYQVNLETNHAWVRYVHPSEMVERKRKYLEKYNLQSPMELKLQGLEYRSAFDCKLGDDMEQLGKKLTEFRKKYPEIVRRHDAKVQSKPKAA